MQKVRVFVRYQGRQFKMLPSPPLCCSGRTCFLKEIGISPILKDLQRQLLLKPPHNSLFIYSMLLNLYLFNIILVLRATTQKGHWQSIQEENGQETLWKPCYNRMAACSMMVVGMNLEIMESSGYQTLRSQDSLTVLKSIEGPKELLLHLSILTILEIKL